MGSTSSSPYGDSSSPLDVEGTRIYLHPPSTGLNRDNHSPDGIPSCVTPLLITPLPWYRNINLFSIAYAFQPRLRIRLTLSGLTFLRNPWVFGERVSHPFYRYSCRHPHFHIVQKSLRSSFNLSWNAPLPIHSDESE